MEKPAVLYHGSPSGEIDLFEPRSNPHRDEPPGIYATPHKYLAVTFMHKNTGMVGHFSEVPYAILFGSREECMKNDTGGHLYELPSTTFRLNVGKGFEGKEWVSNEPVRPISKKEYASSIDAMIEQGIQVYIL